MPSCLCSAGSHASRDVSEGATEASAATPAARAQSAPQAEDDESDDEADREVKYCAILPVSVCMYVSVVHEVRTLDQQKCKTSQQTLQSCYVKASWIHLDFVACALFQSSGKLKG